MRNYSEYLGSELRDRIRDRRVEIQIHDKVAGKRFRVEPQQFEGRPIRQHDSVTCCRGEIHLELYLADPKQENSVALFRSGTRVLERLTDIEHFDRSPWNSRFLQGLVDASFLTLTPGTRTGVVHDTVMQDFCDALKPVEQSLEELLDQQAKLRSKKQVSRRSNRYAEHFARHSPDCLTTSILGLTSVASDQVKDWEAIVATPMVNLENLNRRKA